MTEDKNEKSNQSPEMSIEEIMKMQPPTTREHLQDNLIKPLIVTKNRFLTKEAKVGFVYDHSTWLKINSYIEFAGILDREGFSDAADMIADVAHIPLITSGSLGGSQQNAIISERTEFNSNTFEAKKPVKSDPLSKLKENFSDWSW